jgi:translation initiation factor 1 (eIF-1/SUI1)
MKIIKAFYGFYDVFFLDEWELHARVRLQRVNGGKRVVNVSGLHLTPAQLHQILERIL